MKVAPAPIDPTSWRSCPESSRASERFKYSPLPQLLGMLLHRVRQAALKVLLPSPTVLKSAPTINSRAGYSRGFGQRRLHVSQAQTSTVHTPFRFIFDIMGSILGWLFRTHDIPKLYYSSTVASVTARKSPEKDGNADPELEEMSLQELVEKRCPSLHNTFTPAWWLNK